MALTLPPPCDSGRRHPAAECQFSRRVFVGSRDCRFANTLGRRYRVFVVDDGWEEPLTTEHNMDKVEQIFDQLDDWRHLPTYQLERRADIFFSLYLREILESCTGTEIHEVVVPEFPLRKGTLRKMGNDGKGQNQSYRADYLALSSDLNQAFLIELKTDRGSSRQVQRLYLKNASHVGFERLVDGLLDVFRATKSKRKYFCLLKKMEATGLISGLGSMEQAMANQERIDGFSEALDEIVVAETDPKVSLVCIHPEDSPSTRKDNNGNSDENTFVHWVSFSKVMEIVGKHSDRLSQRFARSLREWLENPAGRRVSG